MRETRVGALEEISLSAAGWMAAALRRTLEAKERAVLGLPGGRSIERPLAALAKETLDWPRIEIFFVDERHLPAGNPDRNDVTVDELFSSLLVRSGKLGETQIHRVPYEPGRPDAAAMRYWRELQDNGGTVDVALFGTGEDGHIASLFPGASELSAGEAGILAVRNSPKPPSDRISMSPALVASITSVCLLFFGDGKREALRRFRDDTTPVTSCPAKLVSAATDLLVVADHAADGGVGG
jgi:6-phosphogluconolactonase